MSALNRTYDTQAFEFLEKYKAKIKTKFVAYDKYFPDDDTPRDIYEITIEREGRKPYTFRFGQSIMNSSGYVDKCAEQRFNRNEPYASVMRYKKSAHKPPSNYEILAAITKHDPGTFENFCSDFGYNTDNRRAMDIYLAVQKEWDGVFRLFRDVLDELSEIS